jgi:predicted nucleic acid-binding protein
MNGKKVLLDSNIIIYLSKGSLDVDEILIDYDEFFISIITYMEVLGFQFDNQKEQELIEQCLEQFVIIHVDSEIAQEVISIRQKKKIKLPDAIIFATAKKNDCDLMTYNVDDFKNIDETIKIVKPELMTLKSQVH